MKKLIRLGLLGLLTSGVYHQSVLAHLEPPQQPYETFADWCANKALLAPETQYTIDLLLEAYARTQDCDEAENVLSRRSSLSFRHDPIQDAAPLTSLTHLTELNLSSSRLLDFAPLASLTNLTTLNLSSSQIVNSGARSNVGF